MYTKASVDLVENTEKGCSPCCFSLHRKEILKPTIRTRWCPNHASPDTSQRSKVDGGMLVSVG